MQTVPALYRLFTLLAFILATLSACVHAAPIPPPGTDASLLPRGVCPSLEEIRTDIKARMKNGGQNTVFYTNPAKDDEALTFALTLSPVGNTWNNVVDDKLFDDYTQKTTGNPPENRKIINRISAVLAQEASGTAYLVTKGGQIKPEGVWMKFEFPNIQRNTKVEKVIQYDLETKQQTEIWVKGKAGNSLLPLPADL
ncbi:hypothetical protein NMY22_g17218 [Coprinellus aureogranulatus]|nr:hypothetical protein NMY22_g17218 [Coprinellus aureogranulatus]